MIPINNRAQLLKEIQEISFTVNDLTLYLDTHPSDAVAFNAFSQANLKRKEFMQKFALEFEPLTTDCISPDSSQKTNCHFPWSDGPLPWDNQGGI